MRAVAEEVPVALVYNGVSHAVMMATPADLEDFALGFSLSEGILERAGELLEVDPVPAGEGIALHLRVTARRFEALKQRRRTLAGRTGCGLCGVEELDQALRPLAPLGPGPVLEMAAIRRALDALPGLQPLNRVVHAVHGAAFADTAGRILLVREDVGRHNALDKLVGALARGGHRAADGFALVTSRCSVELVQKAASAGIAVLVAVSAPTALALRQAERAGMGLVALGRADTFAIHVDGGRFGDGGWRHG
ncbi:formate dehydrogenase accessory sulfurtransferase FdhD [Zavarzinia sp. CC-PAN008]|uniref:formate dehydrogenase accessory sulfurtransferase FdhD n=1 Tax=Zavarzinia sp. CC-PAN008 TaxID=3243332 RepID=UPI003F742F3C